MVLCIEQQKIYSPGGCHEIAFPSTFSHNGPRPTCEKSASSFILPNTADFLKVQVLRFPLDLYVEQIKNC